MKRGSMGKNEEGRLRKGYRRKEGVSESKRERERVGREGDITTEKEEVSVRRGKKEREREREDIEWEKMTNIMQM